MRNTIVRSLGLGSFLLVFSGCGHGAQTPASADVPSSETDAASDGGKQLPTLLRSFESAAEGISDAARTANWTKVSGVLAEALASWTKVKPQLVADGAADATVHGIDDALARIQKDVDAKDTRAAESDANAISIAVPDLFALYPSWPVPPEALRLDGYFRQVQIDAEYADLAAAAVDHAKVASLWAAFRARVQAQAVGRGDIPGASTVVADMDGAIAAERAAIDMKASASVVDDAQRGLDLVDVCEQVFE